jgi:hypothetical protein
METAVTKLVPTAITCNSQQTKSPGFPALAATCKPFSVTCGLSLDKSREFSGKRSAAAPSPFVRCRHFDRSAFIVFAPKSHFSLKTIGFSVEIFL